MANHSVLHVIALGALVTGAAVTARAQAGPAPREAKDVCGTPTATRWPTAGAVGAATEQAGPATRTYSPRKPFPVPPIELVSTAGENGAAPPALPTSQTPPAAAPPAVAPPPVPGLPPAASTNKEDESSRPRVEAIQAKGEVPEERLLDIGVQVFAPAEVVQGVSPEVRKSEGRFVAFHLKKTLEGTGNWGAVRVVPGPGEGLDLFVTGRILESNGKRLEVEVDAVDATGERWFQRRYRGQAVASAYGGERLQPQEPFQELYNRIANDLLAEREKLEGRELVGVRRVSALRFASALSSDAFAPYLASRSGHFSLMRLPAEEDPMFKRVSSIRERDQMLVDTLNEYYSSFYERMAGPYTSWRSYSYQEQDALDRINRQSRLKKILGGAAILTGILVDNNSQAGSAASSAAIFAGMAVMQAGFRQSQEAGVHKAALQELATSFDGEVTPLLVEVEGQQLKLTGSAETQFAAWREMLHQVFALETGLPGDPNAVKVTAPRNN